jgi:hypothetical protein
MSHPFSPSRSAVEGESGVNYWIKVWAAQARIQRLTSSARKASLSAAGPWP